MRYRKQSPTGDYVFGNGSSFFIDNPDCVAQAVRTKLRLYTLEWFLDTREGLDLNHILGSNTQGTRDIEIQQRILATPSVRSILTYWGGKDTKRNYRVNATLDTIYGVVPISEAF